MTDDWSPESKRCRLSIFLVQRVNSVYITTSTCTPKQVKYCSCKVTPSQLDSLRALLLLEHTSYPSSGMLRIQHIGTPRSIRIRREHCILYGNHSAAPKTARNAKGPPQNLLLHKEHAVHETNELRLSIKAIKWKSCNKGSYTEIAVK